ncbi:hypothetical protein [Sulfuricurvum sp.]|uniref:hypothetical protein n=1 Tax=Sulfuricurvum sp. TaxID=2025608 RepID=UPI00261456A6|nr:hypothetical protein [Sulfuricurvum sp.]MDD2267058.1 hypothetical protein [Sulfuricurvum sp.]
MSKNDKQVEEKAATLSSVKSSDKRTPKLYPKSFWKVALPPSLDMQNIRFKKMGVMYV